MVRVLQEHGPERIIVNSACDWGVSDPLKVRKTADAMQAAGFDDDDDRPRRLAQPGRVLRPERPPDPRRPRRAGPDGDVRGQRRAARRAGVRLRHPDGSLLHLAYCSNVHPADDLDGVAAQLERYTARVRERLDVPVLGIGLWVAAPALADDGRRGPARRRSSRGSALEVVTLNGFPYKAFHAPVVKRDVYWPHWAQDERRDYTLGLARLLAAAAARRRRRGLDLDAAARLARRLGRRGAGRRRCARWRTSPASSRSSRRATGKRIRLALEPEPGCTVETIAQACDALGGLAPDWIGVCLDACHLAVQFEDAGRRRVALLADAGVPVVKAQVSSRAARARARARRGARAARRASTSRSFLHQVRECVNCARRGHRRPARGAGRRAARASASGACTSTCRSTPPSTRRRTS